MAQHNINSRIISLNDTKANWDIKADKFVLLKGEIGIETDTKKFKIGDGVSTWAELDYAVGGSGESYDDTEVRNLITSLEENKADKSEIPDISGKADKTELANYVTNSALEEKGYLTSVPSEYVTETELTNKGYATTSALNSGLSDKADKSALYDYVRYSDIEDGLESTSTRKALSANQGRVLNNYIRDMWSNKADKTELPTEYIKKATVSDNLLILTNQDDENTTFGGGSSLSAEPVAIGTTRTGQNDTVVEYYVSSDGNTSYRKYASGWKEFYTTHNITSIGVSSVTLPDGFFSAILGVQILPHSGTENTTLYISKYFVTSTLSNIRFANIYYASSSNTGYNTGKAFVKVVGY